MLIETDYLVVGAGATGLAFVDTLVAEADVEVTVVDRRGAPGGHWLHAYPFVRLHTPSAYYGVSSSSLGADRIDAAGENAGFYERATGTEICEYFADAAARMTQTGRVRFLWRHEHLDGGTNGELVRDLDTDAVHDVAVRRRLVDARYLEGSIPATHPLPFDVAGGARVIPVNDLPAAAGPALTYAVLGSGKTAADACLWLLDNGTDPDRIRWVRPRDAWFYNRALFQPLAQVGAIMEGLALDAEAGACAVTLDEVFERLESAGRFLRIDPAYRPTMYRGTMLSTRELAALRQVTDVVRLGHVRRIEADRIVLEEGEANGRSDVLYVDCTALGLSNAPVAPVFQPGRIVVQQVRYLSPCFNAALVGFIEAHRDEDTDKNRLCPPTAYPSRVEDWPRLVSRTWRAEGLWLNEPDVAAWIAESRLNLLRALPAHSAEPSVQAAMARYFAHVGPAVERLRHLELPQEQ